MSKTKKIIRNIFIALVVLIIIFIAAIWCSFNDQPEVFIETNSAKKSAEEYYLEKYGEKLNITKTDPFFTGGFLFDNGTLKGIEVYSGDVLVYVSDEYITDNRQYNEICAAFSDKFITDERLGTDVETEMFSIDMGHSGGYRDLGQCTDVYFDGDIEAFLKKSGASVDIWANYTGYHEKISDYPNLLEKKLDELEAALPGGINVSITVSDPTLDLPEMQHKYSGGGFIKHFPKYEEYMKLIACCEMNVFYDTITQNAQNERKIYQPSFFNIDEYTAISVNNIDKHIKSAEDFVFTPVDFSDKTIAHRGKYKYDDRAEEEQLTIRREGYNIYPTNSNEAYMLRLDRQHYNIGENTVPLMVTDIIEEDSWQRKRFYISLGYCPPVDCDDDCWYYMDDKYMYLYISSVLPDLWFNEEPHLAFADL
ncbi:MAG: hypothetical protein HDT25_09005 [Ruminococcus sp.]|nr:hypothetical protein [Ruminococcus sp.]